MNPDSATLVFGPIELRLAERRLLVHGQPVSLGSRGFDLLKALVHKRDRVVSKDELLDEVWPGLVVEENNLQVQISGLRRVLGAQAIATVAGLGYRFTLAPTLGPEPLRAALPAPALGSTPSGARLLVADDNKVNRLLLCRSLELMGHQVCSAEHGQQALQQLRSQRFDLLLLDLAMPELDGFGLLELRAQDAQLQQVAVIVTSSLSGVAPVARCIELGADDFLHKPVDPWLLQARVDASLARKRQRDQQHEALQRLQAGTAAQARQLKTAVVLAARLKVVQPFVSADSAQEALEILSHWATLMLDAVHHQGGELNQFSGDALTAHFIEPQSALRAALDMVELAELLQTERAHAGQAPLPFHLGLGLASGSLLLGAVQTTRRTTQACVGEPVRSAQELAARGGTDTTLWLDAATRLALSDSVASVPEVGADGLTRHRLRPQRSASPA